MKRPPGDHPAKHVGSGDRASREIDPFHEHVLEVGFGRVGASRPRAIQVCPEQVGLVEHCLRQVRFIAIRVK